MTSCRGPATQDCLLAEQVSLGLFGEGRPDAAGPQATDCPGVGLGQVPGLAGLVLLHRNEHWNASTVDVLATNQVTRSLGSNHGDVDTSGRLDVAEADVEAVREEQRRALREVRGDRLGVHAALDLVRRQDHDEVGLLDGLGHRDDPEALSLGLGPGAAALCQSDPHVDAGVAQVQRVGVTLAAVADHGDLAPLDHGQVCVIVIEHFSHGGLLCCVSADV